MRRVRAGQPPAVLPRPWPGQHPLPCQRESIAPGLELDPRAARSVRAALGVMALLPSSLQVCLDELEHFLGMVAGLGDGIVDLLDDALLVDDNRHSAFDAERLITPLLHVGEQWKVQLFLVGEFLLELQRVGADANDDGVELSKLLNAVAESARLGRSAAGEGLGIEVQDDVLLPLKVLELEGLGVLRVGKDFLDLRGGQVDVGR